MDTWGCEVRAGKPGDWFRANVKNARTTRERLQEKQAEEIYGNFLERAEKVSKEEREECLVTMFRIKGSIGDDAMAYISELTGVEKRLAVKVSNDNMQVHLRWAQDAEDHEENPVMEMWAVWGP